MRLTLKERDESMSKALQAAIEANDPEAVRAALKGVKDINRKIPGANKPLLYACEKGADKVLEVLFEAGAIAEKKHTFPGDTPFAVAAQHEQARVLEKLWALKQVSHFALEHAMHNAAMEGREKALELILQIVKPPITIGLFRLASSPRNAANILKLLVKYGGDVHGRYETDEAKEVTPLHDRVRTGKPDVMRTLVECGAEINARDSLGRTPLMILASRLERIEGSKAHVALIQQLKAIPDSIVLGDPEVVDGLKAVHTMLELGADATLVDNAGNDVIDHCEFEYQRWKRPANSIIIETLRKAGARGSKATFDLFDALRKKNIDALRVAIKAGADVNRLTPPPVPITPLSYAAWSGSDDSLAMIQLLLEAGADPNKYDSDATPLIRAARSGFLAIVKELIAAGADPNAMEKTDECPCNSYLAATANGKHDVAEFLKSVGARKPKPTIVKPLKPGVESWNDFSELLVKATVETVAVALAKMIHGKAQLDVYGQSLLPGARAYVVVRPRGMNWCNVFQIMPQPGRFADGKQTEAFVRELAQAAGAPALSIEYSDTSDAATVFRAEPDGQSKRDAGWDRDTLEEMVGAMGDEAPAWAKKQLANTDEDEPNSTERLEMLAKQEKFVVAAFWIGCEPGRKLDVDFTGYAADVFDGVAFVSN